MDLTKIREDNKFSPSNVEIFPKAKGTFYALKSKGDQKCSAYVPF